MPGTPQHITLSALAAKVQQAITAAFAGNSYWVVADVTEHSFKQATGYHYFELVEKDRATNRIVAKVKGAAWGQASQKIAHFENVTGQRFTNNIHILVRVAVSFHQVFGLSVEVLEIDPSFTLGVIEARRQETLLKLRAQHPDIIRFSNGRYFTRNAALNLPLVLKRIAVLSSQTSAGNEDFKHTLDNNPYGFHFEIDYYFTVVQNEANAGYFVEKMIELYNSGIRYDAVVINRGGGSQTDFLMFDNYRIGLAVAKFPFPIITGIGHHKNETIADLMAHTRTNTPTKAAEFIITHNKRFADRLSALQQNIVIGAQQSLADSRQSFANLHFRTVNASRSCLQSGTDALANLRNRFTGASRHKLSQAARHLYLHKDSLQKEPRQLVIRHQEYLSNLPAVLERAGNRSLRTQRQNLQNSLFIIKAMSPENILRKGFAIIRKDGEVIGEPDALQQGTDIEIIMKSRQITAVVQKNDGYDGRDFNLPAGI